MSTGIGGDRPRVGPDSDGPDRAGVAARAVAPDDARVTARRQRRTLALAETAH